MGEGGLENVGRSMEWAIAKQAGKILRVQQVAGCKVQLRGRGGGREGGSRSNGHSRERGRGREGERENCVIARVLQKVFVRGRTNERTNGRFLLPPSQRLILCKTPVTATALFTPSFSTSVRFAGVLGRKEVSSERGGWGRGWTALQLPR